MRVLRIVEPVHFVEEYDGKYGLPQTRQTIRWDGREYRFLPRVQPQGRETVAERLTRWQEADGSWAFGWSWDRYVAKPTCCMIVTPT